MIFGIVGVMEIDVVAEELTAHWMVAELVRVPKKRLLNARCLTVQDGSGGHLISSERKL